MCAIIYSRGLNEVGFRGVGWGSRWGQNTVSMKTTFSACKNFKLLCQIVGLSIKNCDILKFVTSVRSGYCAYLPWGSQNPHELLKRTAFNLQWTV